MSIFPGSNNRGIDMKKGALVLGILVFSVFSSSVIAPGTINTETNDYRPNYDFSYDVFDNLPFFPDDFESKRNLLDKQQIPASRLTEEYYKQPEIIPGWNKVCDDIYNDPYRKLIGVYGSSLYPSRFDIQNADINDTFNISAILHVAFGVSVYQGIHLYTKYDPTKVDVEIIYPNGDFLLEPTYPEFSYGWSVITRLKITILDYGDSTIEIMEDIPTQSKDEKWKEQYGEYYTSGGSILGLRIPKGKIFLHTVPDPVPTESNDDNELFVDAEGIVLFSFLFFCLIAIIGGIFYVRRRNNKTKEEN